MEKKYYFRGLGLGIIVTAVIMGIALSGGGKTSEMTDDEVIARARELGMTEDTRLLEPSVEEEKEPDGANINTGEAEQPVKKDVAVKAEAEASASRTARTEKQIRHRQNRSLWWIRRSLYRTKSLIRKNQLPGRRPLQPRRSRIPTR